MPRTPREQRPPVQDPAAIPGSEEELETAGEGSGAPEAEPAGEGGPAAPKLVKITYAGSEYDVPGNLAEVWRKREEEFQQRLSGQGAELGEVRREIAYLKGAVAAAPKPKPEEERPDPEPQFDYTKYETLSLENPTDALKLTHQYQRDRDAWMLRQNQREQERLRGEYTRDQTARDQQRSWEKTLDQFYKDNPDLEHDEDLVDLTYKRLVASDPQMRELATQRRWPEVFTRVADETRKRILSYSGKKAEPPKPTGKGGRIAVTEGGGGPTGGGQEKAGEEEDGTPKTMSAAIRAKQRRHQGAHRGRPDAARRAGTE